LNVWDVVRFLLRDAHLGGLPAQRRLVGVPRCAQARVRLVALGEFAHAHFAAFVVVDAADTNRRVGGGAAGEA